MDVQSLYQNLGSWKGMYWRMRKKVRNNHPTIHNGQYYISKLGEFVFLPYHSYYYINVYRKKRLKSLKPNNGHGLFDFNYYTCLGNGLFKIVTSYIVYSLVPHWLDLLKSMGDLWQFSIVYHDEGDCSTFFKIMSAFIFVMLILVLPELIINKFSKSYFQSYIGWICMEQDSSSSWRPLNQKNKQQQQQ
jgi:hypothetical protein